MNQQKKDWQTNKHSITKQNEGVQAVNANIKYIKRVLKISISDNTYEQH